MDGFVVDVENNVHARKPFSPTKNGMDNSKHLLNLNVVFAMTMRAAYSEPIRLEMAAEALGATGVCVDMNSGALRGEEADAVPLRCKRQPPGDVTASRFRDPPASERGGKLGLEIVQPAEECTGSRDDL